MYYYPKIDNYEIILSINNEKEMNTIISNNISKITTILNTILRRIKTKYIPKNEIIVCVNALQFIDNLNLFIDDITLDKLSKLMNEIESKLNSVSSINYEIKKQINQSIKYTEMTFITHRKEFYKNLYFNNQDNIAKEIELEIKKVKRNGKINSKLFKQIQNVFWIVKNKITNINDKNNLENELNNLKNIIQNSNYEEEDDNYSNYYDDYNNNNYYDKYNKYYSYYNNYDKYNGYNYSYGNKKNRKYYDIGGKGNKKRQKYYINNYYNYNNNYNYSYNNKDFSNNKKKLIEVIISKDEENNEYDESKKPTISDNNKMSNNNDEESTKNNTIDNKDDSLSNKTENNLSNEIKENNLQLEKESQNEIIEEKDDNYFRKNIKNIKSNFNEFYSNFNNNKYEFNNIIKTFKNEDNINTFKKVYLENNIKEIDITLNKYITKLNINNYLSKQLEEIDINKNSFNSEQIIDLLISKLNLTQIIKEALEEVGQEELEKKEERINNTLDNNKDSIINSDFNFDNILRIFKDNNEFENEYKVIKEKEKEKHKEKEIQKEENVKKEKEEILEKEENEEKEKEEILKKEENTEKEENDETEKKENYETEKEENIEKEKEQNINNEPLSSEIVEKKENKDEKKNRKDYIFITNDNLKENNQFMYKELFDLIKNYKDSKLDKEMSFTNFIFSNYNNLDNDNIFNYYLASKILLFQNPSYLSINLEIFENYVILPLYHKIVSNSKKKIKKFNDIFDKYTKIINNVCEKYDVIEEISPYGSFTNTFLDEEGDIDICIVPKCPWFEFRTYANKIINKIKKSKIGRVTLFHKAKSFFLISVFDKETKIELDITIHNLLPIINSKMIKLYSQYDQRFHIMGIYIKHWSKLNKVHGASIQYLSSYSLIIMLIHFLQKIVKPSVLPNLQKIPINDDYSKPQYNTSNYNYYFGKKKMETNIYFEENMEKIDKYMNYINKGKKNDESVANLLLKFFEYYAYYYDKDIKISINKNLEESAKKKHDKIAFSIEDPFESNHNPGKYMKVHNFKYSKFINCMKKEINNILSGEYIKRMSDYFSKKKINTK